MCPFTPANPKASPGPGLRSLDESGSHGVGLHIATRGQKMFILLDRKALKAALIERTLSGGVVVGMPAVGVGALDPLHPGGEIASRSGQDDEVPVIGHEAVSQGAAGHRGGSRPD